MKNKITFTSQNSLYWVYFIGIGAIMFLPIINIPPLFSPAAFAQSTIFKIIFSILLFLFTYQLLFARGFYTTIAQKIQVSYKPAIILAGTFLLLVFLSVIFSANPLFSFWGDPYRAGGFLNLFLYFGFALFSYLAINGDDWKKILNLAIIAGLIVSAFAFLQQFNLFSSYIIEYQGRPPGTLGNTNFLAAYILMLLFIALSLLLQETGKAKRIFYISSLIFFLFTITITLSRAAYLGLIIGFCWFVFLYAFRNKSLNTIKIIAGIALLLTVIPTIYYANTYSQLPSFIEGNSIIKSFIQRLSIENALGNGRISGWKVAWQAVKASPIFGYGPENFAVGFDRFFDPTLPGIISSFGGAWWDRAHNLFFDIAATSGIPSLIVYLLFLGTIFFHIQKAKKKFPENYITLHGMQALLIGYFVNNLFSFDTTATYILFFFLIGYILYLTQAQDQETSVTFPAWLHNNNITYPIISIAGIILLIFIWQYNLVPLMINKEVNWTNYYINQKNECDGALPHIKTVANWNSILNNYRDIAYSDALRLCIEDISKSAQDRSNFTKQALVVAQNAVESRSNYTRSWIYLGYMGNLMLEGDRTNYDLKKSIEGYFQKANELSPLRQEVFSEWTKTYLITGEYTKAIQKADTCINLDPSVGYCWWLRGLAYMYANEPQKAQADIATATEKGFDTNSKLSLTQLSKVYLKFIEANPNNLQYYTYLADIYKKEIVLSPNNFQFHASLAFTYYKLGKTQDAANEALIVFYLSPDYKKNLDAFLQTMHYSFPMPNDANYHFAKAKDYYQQKNYPLAKTEALIALYISPDLRPQIESFITSLPTQ